MDGMPLPGTALPEIGDEIAGKYRIEGVLGQGGMGAVFSAQNLLTGKRVAIKWLLPEHAAGTSRERLLREARIACSVEHPNIVDIYDVGEDQGGLFLVMEYLRGKALCDVLAERGRLGPAELIGVLVPAMRGVHAAHQAGVIHRDLKPENIILSEVDGRVVPKVVDFGISKTVGSSSVPNSSLTRTGALVGTPHYMALEQVDGSNQIDPRTDVYAFGVIMYRALTGHFPFDGSSLGEVILKIGTKSPLPMRSLREDLPPELDTVVLRAMARQREQRFADLEQFARALEPFAPWIRFRESTETSGSVPLLQLASYEPRLLTPSAPGLPHAMDATQPATPIDPAVTGGVLAELAPSNPVERGRRARRLAISSGVALFVILVVFLVLSARRDRPGSAGEQAKVPSFESKPALSVEPELVVPAAAEPVPSQVPAQAPPPGPAEARDEVPPKLEEPAPSTRRHAGRTRSVHEKAALKTPEGHNQTPKWIPGERTKGLSVDDF